MNLTHIVDGCLQLGSSPAKAIELFCIHGGVPTFGHRTQLCLLIDPESMQCPEVWAAAGTWNDVFGVEPHKLVEASGGVVVDLKRA